MLRKIGLIVLAIIMSCSFCIKIDENYKIIYDLTNIFILTFCFLFINNKLLFKEKFQFKILSLFFSLFIIIGESFKVVGSFGLIFHNVGIFFINIIKLAGFYFLFNYLLNLLFKTSKYKFKIKENKICHFIFEKHPFILPFIIIVICYLPYIVAYYPGILSPDPSNQIKQFFHIETSYLDYSILLDENVYITNHHPVLHTVLLGGLAKIGYIMGNVNIGIFFYSIIQIVILVGTLSYTIYYMKKLNTPIIIRLISLIIYALVPVFPFYSMSVVKDVIFNCLVIIFAVKVFDLIKFQREYNIRNILAMIILIVLISMFRNNGIYVILFTMPLLIIFVKKNRLSNIIISMIFILIYFSYSHILLPNLKITPGSIREVLSIPFQQTARYVKYYEDELSDDEKEIIDKVLGINDLGDRYNPIKADPVKNRFNKYATSDDLINYFKVWINGLLKRPNVYLEATLHNTYGYFYPNATNWYIYYKYDKRLINSGVNYKYNNLSVMRKVLSDYGRAFPYIPFLGIIVNIAFCNWIVLIVFNYIIKIKQYKYLIWLMPTISLILVCFASPVNTYFRYAMGIVFQIPIMVSICINILNEKK